jgi:hypothetical protein
MQATLTFECNEDASYACAFRALAKMDALRHLQLGEYTFIWCPNPNGIPDVRFHSLFENLSQTYITGNRK